MQNCLAFSLVRTAALRTKPDFSLDVPSSPTHGDTLTRFSTLCEALAGCRSCVWSVRQCPCYEVLRARDAYLRIYMRGRSQLCWSRHVTPHRHHNCQQNSRGTVSLTNTGKLILTQSNITHYHSCHITYLKAGLSYSYQAVKERLELPELKKRGIAPVLVLMCHMKSPRGSFLCQAID